KDGETPVCDTGPVSTEKRPKSSASRRVGKSPARQGVRGPSDPKGYADSLVDNPRTSRGGLPRDQGRRGPVAEAERPDRGQSPRAASNGARCPDAGRVDRGVRKEGPVGGGRIFRCRLDAFRVRIDPSLQRRKRSGGPTAPQLALPEAQLAAGPHPAFGQAPLPEESRQGSWRSSPRPGGFPQACDGTISVGPARPGRHPRG